jgi:hypothetical protein
MIAATLRSIDHVRPTVGRGPCDAGPKLCCGRRGSASADGNHGYGCDADCLAGTCACSRESSQTFGVVNNSGTVLTRHASQAGRAGGSGRYGSDLLTVRGTAKPVKPLRFRPMRFGANAVWATRAEPMPFWWPTTWGIGECHLRAPISRAAAVRRSERTLFPFAGKNRQDGSKSATSEQITNSPSMSSGHADQDREYRRLGCTATLRLLASRFASQFSLSYRGRRRSLVNLDAGGRW